MRSRRGILSGWCLALACAWLVAAPAHATGPADEPHVRHAGDRYSIVDEHGRELLLRGVNANSLVQYPAHFQQTVAIGPDDLREMAALGFNFLRLPISWSLISPAPGEISQAYLEQIREVVGWAQREGIRVLVDMHQDRYHRDLRPGDEADGAPTWATLTDGKPCEAAFFLSPCSQAAYDNFWANRTVAGKPLQSHFLAALLAVSRSLRAERGLLGFELMNEPTPGTTGSPVFERTQLWPFYRRLITALRRDGERRMLWFEPSILRDVADADPSKPRCFSADRNLVYAPHIYTGTFNRGGLPELRRSVAAAAREARAYCAAWVDAEWGGGSDVPAELRRSAKLALLDRYRAGSGFWLWKQRQGFYNWQVVEPGGELRTDSLRAQQLSRPHVDAVPGELVATRYAAGVLRAEVRGPGGTARLWSGTVVESGAPSLLPAALTQVLVDGRPARARTLARRFSAGSTSLAGFRVLVEVPRGRHTVELRR